MYLDSDAAAVFCLYIYIYMCVCVILRLPIFAKIYTSFYEMAILFYVFLSQQAIEKKERNC
jgi:hypothetical protein